MSETEYFDKQTAVNHFFYAVGLQCHDIIGMEYDGKKDAVLIKYRSGSLWVNTAGDSILAMLDDVLQAVRKHA